MDEPWIKLEVGIFGDRKIKRIRRDEGNDFVLIWIMLLVLAGQCNDRGRISVTEDSPFSPDELAEELGFKESVINRAVTKFQELRMVDIDEEGFLTITNWCKHQNVEGMEKLKQKSEQRKEANQRYYQKRKAQLTESIVEALPEHQTEEKIKTSYKTPIKTSYKTSEKSYSDTTDIDIENKNKSKKKNKNIYGSFSNVLLTEDEFIRLGTDYGEELRDKAIEWFSSYITEKNYKSASHNLTIRRWVMDAVRERRNTSGFKADSGVHQEPTEDNERFYSQLSEEECDRILAEYEAQGY